MTKAAALTLSYDRSRVAAGTHGAGADGFSEEQRAALCLWLDYVPVEAALGIAGRAGLRCTPYLLGFAAKMPTQPTPPARQAASAPRWQGIFKAKAIATSKEDYVDPYFESKFLAVVYCGASALLAAKDAESASNLPLKHLAVATAQLSEKVLGGSALLRSALSAVKLMMNTKVRKLAVDVIVLSIDGAFEHADVDPAARYSYAPEHAADALDAAANDVDFFSSTGNIDRLLLRPLWPASTSANYLWDIMRATLPQDGATELWSHWFDGHMKGEGNLAPLPPINIQALSLKRR